MSVSLNKSALGAPASPAPTSQPPASAPQADPAEALKKRLEGKIFDSYCDASTRAEVIRQGVADGLGATKAAILTDMELESRGWANEAKLLDELDSLLLRFTQQDKKLDEKERADAVQMVCKPKAGYTKGLDFDTAERRIVDFCRANGVKVKVGFFKWAIP